MTEIVHDIEAKVPATVEPLSEPLTVGVEAYLSQEYARAERDKLWTKTWQQVGRVEELPNVGDYLTYNILDDSIIVSRTTPDTISAYYNVCSHRGRQLVDVQPGERDARGCRKQFVCGYHGWRYDLEGKCTFTPQREQWQGALTDDKIRLREVQVDTWGGWIFVNLDPDAEPLRDWLGPVTTLLEPYQLDTFRCRWRRWLIADCNWKVALEAFMEIYHVPYTHPEINAFTSNYGWAKQQGRHSHIGFEAPPGMEENQTKMRIAGGPDTRISTAEMQNFVWENANVSTTETLVEVANRLVDELPEGTEPVDVLKYWLETSRREDAERGAIWPVVTPQQAAASGTAFQIFPNFQIGHGQNNLLCYSARPYGYDPDKCVFEVSVYQIFSPGAEPKPEWVFTPQDSPDWGLILGQDFSNMAAVQRGMKARGFTGTKPNPHSERAVANFHHNLAEFMGTGAPRDLA